MGRKSHGPIRLNGGTTYYARLSVPLKLRALAGKTRLIRSLETTNHSVALKRYGTVMQQLEQELQRLVKGETIQQRINNWSANTGDLTPAQIAEGVLGLRELDPTDPLHNEIYQAVVTGKDLPITWDELVEIWIKERNRVKQRNLSPSSIAGAYEAVKEIVRYNTYPERLTKKDIRKFIDHHHASPTTVMTRCQQLSALIQCGINVDRLDCVNPFSQVSYSAVAKTENKRKAFSDDQLKELHADNSQLFVLCMTGMRPGEYCSRREKDILNNIISIQDEPDIPWQTKNLASIRRVPKPSGFTLTKPSLAISTKMIYLRTEAKDRFNSKQITPHSGRHTFIELSRRAGCDPRVIDAITGHGKQSVSSQYGEYTDDVLTREINKVWSFVSENITSQLGTRCL